MAKGKGGGRSKLLLLEKYSIEGGGTRLPISESIPSLFPLSLTKRAKRGVVKGGRFLSRLGGEITFIERDASLLGGGLEEE